MTYEQLLSAGSPVSRPEVHIYLQVPQRSRIEIPTSSQGFTSPLRSSPQVFSLGIAKPALAVLVAPPRTERGARLLELRKRIVANGTRLLNMNEINEEISRLRRQDR